MFGYITPLYNELKLGDYYYNLDSTWDAELSLEITIILKAITVVFVIP